MQKKVIIILLSFIIGVSSGLSADENSRQEIKLWPAGKMPCAIDVDFTENMDSNNGAISNVSEPRLYFCPASEKKSDATVVICPGGGYTCLMSRHEGFQVADHYNSLGMNAFVLISRIKPYLQPAPLCDVQRAIRLVRRDAGKYGISPANIGVMGFSAGGHLAATASTLYGEKVYELDDDKGISAKPDFSVLIYPVITMGPETHQGSKLYLLGANPSEELVKKYSCHEQVTPETPKTFMVFASDDNIVPIDNGFMYYDALLNNKVNAEFHMYNKGGHGFGIAGRGGLTVEKWKELLSNWLIATVKIYPN